MVCMVLCDWIVGVYSSNGVQNHGKNACWFSGGLFKLSVVKASNYIHVDIEVLGFTINLQFSARIHKIQQPHHSLEGFSR